MKSVSVKLLQNKAISYNKIMETQKVEESDLNDSYKNIQYCSPFTWRPYFCKYLWYKSVCLFPKSTSLPSI